jgi:hypothetical protein
LQFLSAHCAINRRFGIVVASIVVASDDGGTLNEQRAGVLHERIRWLRNTSDRQVRRILSAWERSDHFVQRLRLADEERNVGSISTTTDTLFAASTDVTALESSRPILEQVQKSLGFIPNLMDIFASATRALRMTRWIWIPFLLAAWAFARPLMSNLAEKWRASGKYFAWQSPQGRDVKIFYVCTGDTAKPAILMLHGFPTSSFDFHLLIGKLQPTSASAPSIFLATDFPTNRPRVTATPCARTPRSRGISS